MQRAGGEEQGDLRHGMGGDVDDGADDGERVEQRGAKDDVGELADGRIGEPPLEVVLAQRDQRGDDDGEAGDIDQPVPCPALAQRLDAEDEDDRP